MGAPECLFRWVPESWRQGVTDVSREAECTRGAVDKNDRGAGGVHLVSGREYPELPQRINLLDFMNCIGF